MSLDAHFMHRVDLVLAKCYFILRDETRRHYPIPQKKKEKKKKNASNSHRGAVVERSYYLRASPGSEPGVGTHSPLSTILFMCVLASSMGSVLT